MDPFFNGGGRGDDDALFGPIEGPKSLESFFESRFSNSDDHLVLSSSPSVEDSGIDSSSFESTFTDPAADADADATLTNELPDENEGIPARFSQLYESMTCLDKDEFDGVDSPKRLYNRRPSAKFGKTDDELTKELIVKMSKLSTAAAEFVPMAKKAIPEFKQFANTSTNLATAYMEFQKLVASLDCTALKQSHSQTISATSTPLKPRPNRVVSIMVCLFCQRFGFGHHVYTTHSLRNPVTKELICPNLKDNVCQICGPTDEDWLLHTSEQCVYRTRINLPTSNGFINFK